MKTYVMIHAIADIVCGGPIYDSNKERYLEERGWNVNVLPTDTGKILIRPLEKYADIVFPFINYSPFIFSKKELKEKIEILASHVTVSEKIIIETGTDYTALWGELLARRLNAKHIIMFLDEKNPKVNIHSAPFYRFKFERNELACISIESLQSIFAPYFEIRNPDEHVLCACCANSVSKSEDIDHIADRIPEGDYVIGSIGRLEKPFVPNIISGICEFARCVPDKKVGVCLLGGAEKGIIERLQKELGEVENIEYFISGYIWPIPQNVFPGINVFVSGAGSADVSANQGIPTVRIDVIDNKPSGFACDVNDYKKIKPLEKQDATVCDYLCAALIEKNVPEISGITSLEDEWNAICGYFDEHMEFIERSCVRKEYFPAEKVWNGSSKEVIKKLLFNLMKTDTYYRMKEKWKHRKSKKK